MKKLILSQMLFILPIFAFAYYDDYRSYSRDDDPTMIILTLVIIVWAILNIILFFKIWGMTNDVKEIKNNSKNINKESTTSGVGASGVNLSYYLKKELYGKEIAVNYIKEEIEKRYKSLAWPTEKVLEYCSERMKKEFSEILADSGIKLPELNDFKKIKLGIMPGTIVRIKGAPQLYEVVGFASAGMVIVKNDYGNQYTYNIDDLESL